MIDTAPIEPDELRRRLAESVEPLHPAPTSYSWLTGNIARRSRQRWVLVALGDEAVVDVNTLADTVLPLPRERPEGAAPFEAKVACGSLDGRP
jgi:hypothetical protein